MWKTIEAFVQKHRLLEEGDGVLLGLSGGADSVCLARYLLHVRKERGLRLCAVHINHMLRGGEARRDEDFVRDFCARWEIPLTVCSRDVRALSAARGISLEEAGREARYACFFETADAEGCGKIAVAHQENDLAETMLFRMLRGTGPGGLAAIRPKNGRVIRPLLGVSREQIEAILNALGETWVEDSTNALTDYSRNAIRHDILPRMEEINSAAISHLARLAAQAGELMDYVGGEAGRLAQEAAEKRGDGWHISGEAYRALPAFLRGEVLRRLLIQTAGRQRDIGSVHIRALLSLMENSEGKRLTLPYGVAALREEGGLTLRKENPGGAAGSERENRPCYEISREEIPEDGALKLPLDGGRSLVLYKISGKPIKIEKKDCVKWLAYDKIGRKLCIRTRREGDYFILNAAGDRKSLRRYFIDRKIPAGKRDAVWLLADGSHILWVIGERISEACKVTEETEAVLVARLCRGD